MKKMLSFILLFVFLALSSVWGSGTATKYWKKYLLYDDFRDAKSAGNINAQTCTPGPGTRTVTDTESKLTIANGQLVCAGGKAAPAEGDPGYWLPAVTRIAGRILKSKLTITDVTQTINVGFDNNQAGTTNGSGQRIITDTLKAYDSALAAISIATVADLINYPLVTILRATGAYHFYSTNNQWLLLWPSIINSAATLYPGISNNSAAFTCDYLRVPYTLWLPSPVFSDGMSASGASDGLGHAETTGIGSGGGGVVTDYTVSGGVANIVPTLGAELVTNQPGFDADSGWTKGTGWTIGAGVATHAAGTASGLYQTGTLSVVGQWYQGAITVSNRTAGTLNMQFGGAAGVGVTTNASFIHTDRATNAGALGFWGSLTFDGNVDNASFKPLTVATLIKGPTQEFGSENVTVDIALAALTTGTQNGLALRVDSLTDPANFVLIYLDGSTIKVEQCIAGVYNGGGSALLSQTQTFTASGILRVRMHDNKCWLWYAGNGTTFAAISGSPVTITSSAYKYHRVFSTYSGNTCDNLIIRPLGTNGEYSVLDKI